MSLLLLPAALSGCAMRAVDDRPNFVVLFADDLGYGDLACYGHPTIRTPELDRMAAEGLRFTQFYSAAEVCTPSRAALMTGRLPPRSGLGDDHRRVLFADSAGGMPDREITLAEALKARGYVTACVGKWHLGHLPRYLPTRHGFDSYYGIPYSNDMKPTPILRNEEVIEEPADQATLTPRYTAEAVQFIKANRSKPFFLYLPYTFPHTPLHASERFKDKSRRGLYGDVVEEIDWSVGQILGALRELGLAGNTLVFFTSDNGPWLVKRAHGGSAGLLREGKGTTWEGGMREPGLAWWPGRIKSGTLTRELASTMDIFPTCVTLAGGEVPADRVIDGVDLAPILFDTGPGHRDILCYYRGMRFMAFRKGPWKAHFITQGSYGTKPAEPVEHDPPLLFNLEHDPSEQYNVAEKHPDIVADILAAADRHRAGMDPAPSQLKPRLSEE